MRELELPDVQDVMLEYRKIKLLYRSALKDNGSGGRNAWGKTQSDNRATNHYVYEGWDFTAEERK